MSEEYENESGKIVKIVFGIIIFAVSLFFSAKGYPDYLILTYSLLSYFVLGYEVIKEAVTNIFHGNIFDENFLMTVATVGAFALGEYKEAVMVMLLFNVGEYLEESITEKSERNIEKLLDIIPDKAHLINQSGEMITLTPDEVKENNIIRVLPGEKVPLDGIMLSDWAYADTKAINGESVPKKINKGEFISSGYIILNSPADIRVTAVYEESTVAKIIKFTENAEKNKGKTEKFITRFAKYYTPAVCIFSVFSALIPSFITGNFSVWIKRSLTFLVVSCPCALVISIPLAFIAGIGKCSSEGILVKGGIQLETLSKSEYFAFDKTGTLTEGMFKVRSINGVDTLKYALSLEKFSNHPIASAIKNEALLHNTESLEVSNVTEDPGYGIKGEFNGVQLMCGNAAMMEKYGINFIPISAAYSTIVYVSYGNECCGYIEISDSIKEDASGIVSSLKSLGVKKTFLLSGDSESAVSHVSETLKIDEYHGNLLPLDKVEMINSLKKNGIVAFAGDGVNDAPVISVSDIGISMGHIGSDAAIESSGIVITSDKISKIPYAMKIAKKSMLIAKQNIAFCLTVKFICMALNLFGSIPMALAVFADTGVTLLCVVNSVRALSNN